MYYTSYFGNIKKINRDKYKLVSITNSKPSFCDETIGDWSFLGPSKDLLYKYKNGEINEMGYTQIYNKFLEEKWNEIKDYIIYHKDENIVMLCYEKPSDFCHRHLLSSFLNDKGIKCEELK